MCEHDTTRVHPITTEPLRFRGTRDSLGTIHVAYCQNTKERGGQAPLDIIEKYTKMKELGQHQNPVRKLCTGSNVRVRREKCEYVYNEIMEFSYGGKTRQ